MDSQLRALFRRATAQFDMPTYRLYTNQLLRSGSGNIVEWLQYLVPMHAVELTTDSVTRKGYLLRLGGKSWRESSQFVFYDPITNFLYAVRFREPSYVYQLPALGREPRIAIQRNRQLDLDQIDYVLETLFSISDTPVNFIEILGYMPLGFGKLGVQIWEQCVGPLGPRPTVGEVAKMKNAEKLFSPIPVEAWLPLLLEDSYECFCRLIIELNRDLNSDVRVTNEGYRIAVVDRKTGQQILKPLIEHIQVDNLLRASGTATTTSLYRRLSGDYQIVITRETLYEFLSVKIQDYEHKLPICGHAMTPRRYWLPAYLPPVEEEDPNWAPWPLMNWPINQVLRMLGRLAEYEDTPTLEERRAIERQALERVNALLPQIAHETYGQYGEPIPPTYAYPLNNFALWTEIDEGMEHGNYYRNLWLYARASNSAGLVIQFNGMNLHRTEPVSDNWRWFQNLQANYQIYQTEYWHDIA